MRYIIISILYIFVFISPVFTQNTWHTVKSPTQQNLARLDMISDSSGWAVSYDGLILKYAQNKWEISTSLNQIKKRDVSYSDSIPTHIADWGDIYNIRMIDPANGWIAVNHHKNRFYRLLKFDGREWKSWKELFPLKLRAIDFLNDSSGIVVGEGGGFQYLNNRWHVLLLPISVDFIAVKFISPDDIFITGENGTILHKKTEWSVLESPTIETLREMDFISPDEGWFVGKNGVILHYEHGIITQEETNTTADLWAVDMVSRSLGFAVGKQGTILKYNGKNWEHYHTNIQADLHDIEMLDENNGWIVGGRGIILKYGSLLSAENQQQPHHFLFMDQVFLGSSHLMDLIDDVQGIATADFNGDNLPDIYFTCSRSLNHLLLNQGQGYYIDYTIESGTGGDIESRKGKYKIETGALAADFDRDGDVDILLAGKRGTTRYLMNKGNAVFQDRTRYSSLPDNLNITTGALADFNKDGYPDIILVDELMGLRLLINRKYNRFKEKSLNSVSLPLTGIRALAVADFTGDQITDMALFLHQFHPILLINNGNAEWQKDQSVFIQSHVSNFVNSVTVADFNNDGFNDLFLCTENSKDALLIYDAQYKYFLNQSIEWNIQQEGRSYSGTAGDFDHDGDLDLYVARLGQDFLYLNEDNRCFNEAGQKKIYSKVGYLSGYNTGTATTDIDADGDLDLIVGNLRFWSSLLQNNQNDSNFITIDLKGVADTREALGAKIWIWQPDFPLNTGSLIAFREVNLSNGFFSQNTNIVHVGLGHFDSANIKIRYINGDEFHFEAVPKGSTITVHQSGYTVRSVYKVSRALSQLLHNPYITLEILKLFIFVLLIFISVRFIEKRYQWRPAHIVVYVLVFIILYSILTLLLPRISGIVYHVMPFGLVIFTLIVLISVNEQIRKSNLRRNLIQAKLQDASAALSGITVMNNVISLVIDTLKVIYSYRFFIFYRYYSNGNYFLCKKYSGIINEQSIHKIILNRRDVYKLTTSKSPLSYVDFTGFWPGQSFVDEKSLLFPLVFENELHGVIILGKNKEIDSQVAPMLHYLFFQMTLALNNIQKTQELQDQQKLVAIGTFTSGIIHNLKNPVDGLRMMIEVLFYETQPGDPSYEFIKEIHHGVIKLKQTLMQSFDIINYTTKTTEDVYIHTLIHEIDKRLKSLNYPQLELRLEDNGHIIKGNQTQLKLVFENIIQNALEASDNAHSVTVRTGINEHDEMLWVEIIDKGSGIQPDKLDKIFDMFYSTHGDGRGLGLTITQHIIKNHGGYIDVSSTPGQGTQFTVGLPIYKKA